MFGITMWEMLYRSHPYPDMPALEVALSVVSQDLRPPLDIPPPRPLRRFVSRGRSELSHDPPLRRRKINVAAGHRPDRPAVFGTGPLTKLLPSTDAVDAETVDRFGSDSCKIGPVPVAEPPGEGGRNSFILGPAPGEEPPILTGGNDGALADASLAAVMETAVARATAVARGDVEAVRAAAAGRCDTQ
jgi:hypothetical protein